MKIYPSKRQFKNWSLISQVSYFGFLASILGVIAFLYTILKDIVVISTEPDYSPKQEAQVQALYSYFAGEIEYKDWIKISERLNSSSDFFEIQGFDEPVKGFNINNKEDKKSLYQMELPSYAGVLEYNKPNSTDTIRVFNCNEYSEYREHGYAMTGLDNRADGFFYCYCKFIDFLQDIKPAEISYIEDKNISNLDFWSLEMADLNNLDWSDIKDYDNEYGLRFLTRNSRRPTTVRDFMFYGFIEIGDFTENSIQFLYPRDSGFANYYLELIRGDFNNDKIEDVAVYIVSDDYFGGTIEVVDIEIWTMYPNSEYFEILDSLGSYRVP